MKKEWMVQFGEEGRLDKFISYKTGLSRSIVQKEIEKGAATLNKSDIFSGKQVVQEGDQVDFTLPKPRPEFPSAFPISLPIIYEDSDLIVLNKPAGIVVHPSTGEENKTLVNALIAYYPDIVQAVYDPENPTSRLRPGIVHRLDKDTSGLLVVAKNRASLQNLAKQFQDHTVHKAYHAFLYGEIKEPVSVNAPIQRKGGMTKNIMRASHDSSKGRAAVSHFQPLEVLTPYSAWPTERITRALVTIETGRTHQIRVHAKFIGHPVLGDTLYDNKLSQRLSEKLGITSQSLQSCQLSFTQPRTGERLEFTLPPSLLTL